MHKNHCLYNHFSFVKIIIFCTQWIEAKQLSYSPICNQLVLVRLGNSANVINWSRPGLRAPPDIINWSLPGCTANPMLSTGPCRVWQLPQCYQLVPARFDSSANDINWYMIGLIAALPNVINWYLPFFPPPLLNIINWSLPVLTAPSMLSTGPCLYWQLPQYYQLVPVRLGNSTYSIWAWNQQQENTQTIAKQDQYFYWDES